MSEDEGVDACSTADEMRERAVRVGLVRRETLEDDGVGAFAVDLDLAVGAADERGHAFARGVELADVQDLVLK